MPDPAAHDRLLSHLQALVGERHPVTSPGRLRRAEEYLADTFAEFGLQVAAHPFTAWDSTYRNVIASLFPTHGAQRRGPGTVSPPLILAAHYDTVENSPGADDNASALAVLLETARRLRSLEREREVQCIAFCLEESDLLGSRAYVGDLRSSERDIAGAIVLECVGFASEEEGSQTAPAGIPIAVPTVGNFLAIVGNDASAALAATVARAAESCVPVVPFVVPGTGSLLPDTRRSDHAAFWDAGYPAVMLTDTANFRNPHYHRPTDTLATLNLTFLLSVADALTTAVCGLIAENKN